MITRYVRIARKVRNTRKIIIEKVRIAVTVRINRKVGSGLLLYYS